MKKSLKQAQFKAIALGGAITLSLIAIGCQTGAEPNSTKTKTETTTVAQSNNSVQINQMAPDFTGVDTDGVSHNLSDFKGKVVVLEWTNHQCPFVKKHYDSGNMQKLQKDAIAKDVVWLSIISSAPNAQGYVSPSQADRLTTSRNASPTAVILDPDGDIGRLYNARTTPEMYVIDRDGILRYMGAIDDKPTTDKADVETANNYVSAALDSVLDDRAVATAVTRPYGCSVKYKN